MLKKTKKELLLSMGSDEITKWMAFTQLQDDEYKQEITNKVALEEQQQMTDEQRADAIRKMFMDMNNGNN